ncbi:hypothetical protein GO495_28960 [Chitinophaga oryziterrae]|uniref:Effector-associated domain-containing protein n=1 Tax=Chitinophaga oryziterrae TaxID=1031224 RepID=A0A6N8JK78_9BACT|nr:SIR2 family protein [Chitinophaga oryziterrae]MVT44658.1 hypothetical protein [Chitinophaga oryziterrae]
MAKLSPKSNHQLVRALAEQFDDADKAKAYCAYADINTGNIDFSGSAIDMWRRVIKEVEIQERTINLLEKIIEDYNGIELYQQCIIELRDKQHERLNKIIRAINVGQCILFLGPGVLIGSKNGELHPFNRLLANGLADIMDKYNLYYDVNLRGDLSYMAQRFTDMPRHVDGDVGRYAKKLFQELIDNLAIETKLFELLAPLPFKAIINANADDLLYQQIYKISSGDVAFSYYDSTNIVDDKSPSINYKQPIVYNIFGAYQNDLSILYTEGQFLDFIIRILQSNPAIDKRITNEFERSQYYLFLGFDFNQWYFKVLFEVLKLRKENERTVSLNASSGEFSVYNREFFEQEFKFYFINEELPAFTADLIRKFKAQNV